MGRWPLKKLPITPAIFAVPNASELEAEGFFCYSRGSAKNTAPSADLF
jgi:hypothetical protein